MRRNPPGYLLTLRERQCQPRATAWAAGNVQLREMLRAWLIVYIGNFIGATGTAMLVFLSGHARALLFPMRHATSRARLTCGPGPFSMVAAKDRTHAIDILKRLIDKIFRWLKLSDEPRTFLYGKGGSGKTTIAYEVAKAVRDDGANLRIYGNEKLDAVIFISAKQTTLNVLNQTTNDFVGRDFSNEKELYEAILTLANWTSDSLNDLDLPALRAHIKDLFDLTSNLIVIDDIDTLTTKGTEAGFDFLYRTLSRSKRQSKLLYTIRNAPTHSIANSIEVPGLIAGEYEEFVSVCASQFNVPNPDPLFISGTLAQISERRPLVVESIIALRRSAGTYENAAQLFNDESGEDVRSYVFKREWNSLTSGNYGRYVLAVLALYNAPMEFDDIAVLTQYEASRVKDSLADVREMFLQLNEIGPETTFQLGSLTLAFVLEQSKKLDLYPVLKERVDKYKREYFPDNPIFSRMRDRVERLVLKGFRFADEHSLEEALRIVSDRTLAPKISEDPRFTALHAYVIACQKNPNMDDVRRLFKISIEMGFEPDLEHLKRWFYAERDSQHGINQCIMIADMVCNGKKYSGEDKIEFLSRKGGCLYNKGKQELPYEPENGLQALLQSLKCHLSCYTRYVVDGSIRSDKSEEYARNTGLHLFSFIVNHGRYDEFPDVVADLLSDHKIKCDPLEDAITNAMELTRRRRYGKSENYKTRTKIEQLKKEFEKNSEWFDQGAKKRVLDSIGRTIQNFVQPVQSE